MLQCSSENYKNDPICFSITSIMLPLQQKIFSGQKIENFWNYGVGSINLGFLVEEISLRHSLKLFISLYFWFVLVWQCSLLSTQSDMDPYVNIKGSGLKALLEQREVWWVC